MILLIWPFFLCCFCCQDDCPARCCCSDNPRYSSCELNRVNVVLILASLTLVIACALAMTNSGPYFTDLNCKTARLLANFQNGNQI